MNIRGSTRANAANTARHRANAGAVSAIAGAMAGVDSAPPEPASDEIELSAPPVRLPTAARTSRAYVPLAAILRSGSCRTSRSGHR